MICNLQLLLLNSFCLNFIADESQFVSYWDSLGPVCTFVHFTAKLASADADCCVQARFLWARGFVVICHMGQAHVLQLQSEQLEQTLRS